MLRISTRVLMALAERQKPADKDVAKLQRFAPQRVHEGIYPLAYYVAQEALQKRRESRAARRSNACHSGPESLGHVAASVGNASSWPPKALHLNR